MSLSADLAGAIVGCCFFKSELSKRRLVFSCFSTFGVGKGGMLDFFKSHCCCFFSIECKLNDLSFKSASLSSWFACLS